MSHTVAAMSESHVVPAAIPVHTLCRRVLEKLREDGVEVELLDEDPAAPHPDLPEDVLEMILHRVLGDVLGLRNLPGVGPTNDQIDHFLLAGT